MDLFRAASLYDNTTLHQLAPSIGCRWRGERGGRQTTLKIHLEFFFGTFPRFPASPSLPFVTFQMIFSVFSLDVKILTHSHEQQKREKQPAEISCLGAWDGWAEQQSEVDAFARLPTPTRERYQSEKSFELLLLRFIWIFFIYLCLHTVCIRNVLNSHSHVTQWECLASFLSSSEQRALCRNENRIPAFFSR